MPSKKKISLLALLCGILLMGGILILKQKTVIKTSISKSDLIEKKYILCQYDLVTGFEWSIMQDENGNVGGNYCIISGVDPKRELKLKEEFMTADNTFIFYITEKKENSFNNDGQRCVEYVVSGWDILYPVKHGGVLDFLGAHKYITKNDVNFK